MRVVAENYDHAHTHTQGTSTVTLAVHVRRGLTIKCKLAILKVAIEVIMCVLSSITTTWNEEFCARVF